MEAVKASAYLQLFACVFIHIFLCFNSHFAADEGDLKMSVAYNGSTVAAMDMDSKIGYKQFFSEGSKFQYSVYALRNNPFRLAAACFGLLCVLLLAVVIGQSVHHNKVERDHQSNLSSTIKEKENLQERLSTVQKQQKDLQTTNSNLQQTNNFLSKKLGQTMTNNNLLIAENAKLQTSESELKTSNTALTKQTEELKVANEELDKSNTNLVTAKNYIQTQYDLMLKRRNELQESYATVSQERNNLQNQFNNVTRAKELLQLDYDTLVKDVEHLQDRYNFSNNEKEMLESSHQNLTMSKETLQASYNSLTKATDKLRAALESLTREKIELEENYKNVSSERDRLRVVAHNLTVERDQLLADNDRLSTDKKCPTGWKKFQGSCYYISAGKKKWKDSRDYCKMKKADLAIIKTQEEMRFLNNLFSSNKEVWIGLTDGGLEGQWKWVDGTPLTTTFWGDNQPNSYDGRNQDCVEFWHLASRDGSWNDEHCNVENNWMCEM
uniref:C-type lectin domain family 4 member M-like n=2 Tax=Takifugu rubripes TaxID=31033 RepID=A0A674P499_TAKRU